MGGPFVVAVLTSPLLGMVELNINIKMYGGAHLKLSDVKPRPCGRFRVSPRIIYLTSNFGLSNPAGMYVYWLVAPVSQDFALTRKPEITIYDSTIESEK
jgi:hypothetical protein